MTNFEIPPNVHFTCTQCGDCCRTWMVPLGPGEANGLRALSWPERTTPPSDIIVPLENARGRERLARRGDGSCVFLGGANQCLLHEHFGANAKPLVCRLYPFAFLPLGSRTAVDVSFFCRAVSEQRGEELSERVPEWTLLLREHPPKNNAASAALTPEKNIPPDLLWEFEFHLVSFLKDQSLAFPDRIRCCLKFLDLTTTGDPAKDSSRFFREAIAQGIPNQIRKQPLEREQMNPAQSALFFQDLFLALNPAPGGMNALSIMEQSDEKQRRLAAAEKFRERSGNFWIDGEQIDASFDSVARVSIAPLLDTPARQLLENFFVSRILGQRFLFAGERQLPLVEATHRLMLNFPWALWTARAFATLRHSSAADTSDLRRALRLLDRSIGQGTSASLKPEHLKALRYILLESHLVETSLSEILE